jgi:SnoaL-like domain
MIEQAWAESFAREWIEGWNTHDLDRIMAHYRNDLTMTSPLIEQRMQLAGGSLQGKLAVREYWAQGLAAAPDLHFQLVSVFAGVRSIGIVFTSASLGKTVVEYLEFDDEQHVVRSEALWKVG